MPRKLNALDLAFLSLEKQTTPVNVASLMILQYPEDEADTFPRDLLRKLESQPPGPPFNQKLSSTSTAMLPEWVTDKDFDIHYHVKHQVLPKGASEADLLALVSDIHGRILDRQRPLWEFYLFEGLEGNRLAIYMKMHHACIDGMGGVKLLESCLTPEPGNEIKAPWQGLGKKSVKASESTLTDKASYAINMLGDQVNMVQDLSKIFLAQGIKRLGLNNNTSASPFTAPKSALNVPITETRRFAIKNMSLTELKDIGKQAGVTVNDIVLALCSGALRRYLKEQNKLPKKPLSASVPVALRRGDRPGNQITYVLADLATNEADSFKRLEKIAASTEDAKHEISDVSAGAATNFAVMAQGLVAALNQLNMTKLLPPVANVTISNVPGPRQPLYLGQAQLMSSYPLSVLIDGQALNITVFSYCDTVSFGMLACRDVLPDVDKLASYIDHALDRIKGGIFLKNLMAEQQKEKAKKSQELAEPDEKN